MKILVLSSEFPPGPGGIGTHAFQLASGLNKNHAVHVLACQDYMTCPEVKKFNLDQSFVIQTMPSRFWKFIRPVLFASVLNKIKPDLVLASGDRMLYLAAFFKFFSKSFFVGVEHGRVPVSDFERKIKKWACFRLDKMICVSQYTRDMGADRGYLPEKSEVIHNGADENVFKILPEAEWKDLRPPASSAHVLITVGQITERKGQEIIIQALPEILKTFPGTHYWMVGLPTLRPKLEELSKKLGVSDHVHFLGKVAPEELVRRLNASDIFLMTSRHAGGEFEGFGIAVAEAALCGKPAIVAGNSGLKEAILPGETGVLVPAEDAAAVAGAVMDLLSSPDKRTRMGKAARQFAIMNQSWKQCVAKYERLCLSQAR